LRENALAKTAQERSGLTPEIHIAVATHGKSPSTKFLPWAGFCCDDGLVLNGKSIVLKDQNHFQKIEK
jgi:hypothetical protein